MDEAFNPYRTKDGLVDYIDGGEGSDTVYIEDVRWARGGIGELADITEGEDWLEVDFDSIEIYRSSPSGDADDHFKIEGFDKDETTDWYVINATLNNVERIDLREYNDIDPAAGSQDTEVYVR